MNNVQKALAKVNEIYPFSKCSEERRQEKFDFWLKAFNDHNNFMEWLDNFSN